MSETSREWPGSVVQETRGKDNRITTAGGYNDFSRVIGVSHVVTEALEPGY